MKVRVPRVHENPKKSDTSTFMTPGTWNFTKMNRFDFLQLSWTMKILKNQTIQFSSIFMTPGTWKSSKIRQFNFLQFSWFLGNYLGKMTPGTWNFTKIRCFDFPQLSWPRGYIKNLQKSEDSIFKKNQTFWFYSIFKKIEVYDFCGFSCTRVHENP